MAEVFCYELDGDEHEGGVGKARYFSAGEAGSCPGEGEGCSTDGEGAEKREMFWAGRDAEGEGCQTQADEEGGDCAEHESGDKELQSLLLP